LEITAGGETPQRKLSLFDSTCLAVGIIIGVGIYETAPAVARGMPSDLAVLGIWALGGILSMAGALCYAELAGAYPRAGGDYVYLTRAYGGWAGYLFAWAQTFVIRPGDIALLAFVFGGYARTFGGPFAHSRVLNASVAVAALTAINILGVREGKWTQNLLTTVKAVGLLGVVAAALAAPASHGTVDDGSTEIAWGGAGLSLILVLFTFGGWSEVAYVAAEVKDPGRNIVRSVVLGIASVTGLYVLVNGAFLYSLGRAGMGASDAVAVDAVRRALPQAASFAIALLVGISALGSINGLVLTGARITYAMGADHGAFRLVGRWDPRSGTPIRALLLQGVLGIAMILLLESFDKTILYTAPAVWAFFLATGLSVFVLRRKEPDVPRPYRVVGYPVTPIVFCGCSVLMIYSSVSYAVSKGTLAPLVSGAIILAGLPAYGLSRLRRPR